MNDFDSNKFKLILRAVRQMVRCPNCGSSFMDNDVQMVAGMGSAYFVKMSCGHCGLNVMASLMQVEGQHLVNNEPLKFNFDSDILKTKNVDNTEPISTNDVIGAHEFLDSFKGDFKSLIKKK